MVQKSALEPKKNINAPEVKAALVVIGNEILTGRTQDVNTPYLGEKLWAMGIALSEVRIVPDIEADIVCAIRELAPKYSYVFTTGGIGPTHDDITAKSIAKAMRRKMNRNPEAIRRLKAHYDPEEFTESRKKMADMPHGVELIDNPVSAAPGFVLDNIYVLAGVPEIMRAMFDSIVHDLKGGKPYQSKTLTCHLTEGVIAPHLALIQKQSPQVEIGSYPFFRGGVIGVSVVLRSTNEIMLQRVVKDVKDMVIRLDGNLSED